MVYYVLVKMFSEILLNADPFSKWRSSYPTNRLPNTNLFVGVFVCIWSVWFYICFDFIRNAIF